MFRICSATANYILEGDTSKMEIYEMKAQLLHPYNLYQRQYIVLHSISIGYKYYIIEPILHCLVIVSAGNEIELYIILHPIEQDSIYLDKMENCFRLKMHLGKLGKRVQVFLRINTVYLYTTPNIFLISSTLKKNFNNKN